MRYPLTVELPDFESIAGKEPGYTLVKLYNYLIKETNAPKKCNINPTHIWMNNKDWSKLVEFAQSLHSQEDKLSIGFMWMNQGPSGFHNDEVPSGKVIIHKEAFTIDQEETA